MRCRKIAVVLSTYNGSAYLIDQLDSIYNQNLDNDIDLSVYARDDGSCDETLSILNDYACRYNLQYSRCNNVGVCSSFFEAIQSLPDCYDYVALCDQDDVWHDNKLKRAIERLDEVEDSTPALYCSEYYFCDKSLNRVKKSDHNKIGISLEKMLYENICSGNTMVMNRSLYSIVRNYDYSQSYCHDWSIALLAASVGKILFDSSFYSLEYRRLDNNASPTGAGLIPLLVYRFRKYIMGQELSKITSQMVSVYYYCKQQLGDREDAVFRRFIFGNRLSKAFAPFRLRQTLSGEIVLRLLFLFGRV